MTTYTEIIKAWGREKMAQDLCVPKERVRGWERYNKFPAKNWKLALEVAPKPIGLSPNLLIDIAARN